MSPLRAGVVGADGRVGRLLQAAIAADTGWALAFAKGRGDAFPATAEGVDVVLDFSTPDSLSGALAWARRHGVPLLTGTTGLPPALLAEVDATAADIPVLVAPNTSVGVQVLAELVAAAVAKLGPGWDVEIVETHHRDKRDAPSGTALRLADAACTAHLAGAEVLTARQGDTGPRHAATIGVAALRGGDIVGDHTVHLLGPGERLELTHRATDRRLFALGALRAAAWLCQQPPGRHTMAQALGPAPR